VALGPDPAQVPVREVDLAQARVEAGEPAVVLEVPRYLLLLRYLRYCRCFLHRWVEAADNRRERRG